MASGGDDGGATGPAALGVGLFSAPCNGQPAVDWSPVRRVSRVEYNNMVRDLLGDRTQPATAFVAESPLGEGVNFQTNTYTGVGATDTIVPQQYLTAAETLAAAAVADSNSLQNVFNANGVNSACSTQGDPCAQAFIGAFANSAFRGQFDTSEGTSLFQNVYAPIKAQFDFATGIQAVITAVLTSPRFLYVLEFGQPGSGTLVPLSGNELATRLALFLWRSIPDATLLQAAAGWGSLSGDQLKQQLQQQAVRMLADTTRAPPALNDFAAQWMEITTASSLAKDSQYTVWNNNQKLAAELVGETLANYRLGVLNDGSFVDLMSSSESYVNPDVASYYAGATTFSGSATDPYAKANVSTASNPRAGILTNPIVLAAQSHTSFPSPTLRGKLVREQVLCDAIQPPPAGLMIGPPPSTVPSNATVKDQYASHRIPGSVCANCHNLIDTIGDGFGVYDATGMYQSTEVDQRTGGPFPTIDPSGQVATYQVIDPSGTVIQTATGELTTTFTGPTDLATQLANSTQARQCFALQQIRYALSRVETQADACSAQQVYQAFASNNFSLNQVLLAVVQSDAFLYRTAVTSGSACQ
jgi:hypothetical protein